jgi:hypothetical protein
MYETFDIILEKFNAVRICTHVTNSFQNENNNNNVSYVTYLQL